MDSADHGQILIEMLFFAEEALYDLTLMDLQMPVIGGLEAMGMIPSRTDSQASKIPIVAFTAHAMAEDREPCLKSGMCDYISKPFDSEKIIKMLQKAAEKTYSSP